MDIIIVVLIAFVAGVITTKVVSRTKRTTDEPIGDLYLSNDELFLNLEEDIVDKKYITLRVVKLDSHK